MPPLPRHLLFLFLTTPALAAGTEIFRDDFSTGSSLDSSKWILASYTGTQGRTTYGPHPLAPTVQSGYATLSLNTYDPDGPGTTLKGTEITAKVGSSPYLTSLGTGVEFETRLRINTTTPGIINAFYTYGSHNTSLSDEIDFEFASKDNNNPTPPAGDAVYLTTWNDWSSGANSNDTSLHSYTHPNVPALDTSAWTTLMVRWLPDRTEWYINNTLIRTTTQAHANDPMSLDLSIWAPDSSWGSAYSSLLQPTSIAANNISHTMDVDYVTARQIPANAWSSATSGTWSTPSNWTSASPPAGTGTAVSFLNIPNSPTTVTLDTNKTVGSLTFDSPNSYTLTTNNSSTLTLDVTSGSSTLTSNSGSHLIAAPVILNDNTTANIAAGSSLTLSSLTSSSTLTKSTGTGTLILKSFHLNTLTISAGTVQIAPSSPVSKLTALNASTGLFDLTNNTLLVDYTGSSPIDTLRFRLQQARISTGANAGNWTGPTGITSSYASPTNDPKKRTAIAYAEASNFPSSLATQLAGSQTYDSTTLFLKYTYYGDINLDGVINQDDYALLDRNAAKHLSNAHWTDGDFDYDGSITSSDYSLIDRAYALQTGTLDPSFLAERESQFGETYVSQLIASVPEPACSFLILLPFTLNRKRSRP